MAEIDVSAAGTGEPGRPAPLQPGVGDGPVPDEWIAEFEGTAEARYLERLAADRALIYDLQWSGFAGQGWDRLAEALIEYGLAVIRGWILKGEVFARCRERRLGGRTMYNPRYIAKREDADELAYDTVGIAIVKFRENVLKKGRWSADRGATLKTFFVGQVLFQFVDTYRHWLRMQSPAGVSFEELDVETLFPPAPAAEEVAFRRLDVQEALTTLSDVETKQILALTALGYSQEEIATIVGVRSAKAVEDKIYRHRKRIERASGE